ncbi:MFS transporter [Microlunatus flavus]|uniref:Predicted arabinose efflux permease, MFS family n=1 Tax=Microlunatus flavus TaxID=1036181 RepID=A0A1H9ICJ6_9ACTN|nr:MFS transporter [Microlunatus flavus]SEQ72313.1 Predicted arabinose efflux permease, MFS family [Microlunatus flavus]
MLSRPVSFVVAGTFGAATLTAASAPSPLYPVYQRLWGLSAFALTVVFAVYVVALLASLLTVGSLSDRVGRRPVASAALVLLAVGMVLFALAGGPGGLVVARVVQGIAVGAAAGTGTAMIMDSAPHPRTGSVVSSAVPALGIALGAVLAGALVEFAPLPRQLVFWVLAAAYVVLAALVWFVREPSRPAADEREPLWRALLPSAGLPATVRPAFLALVPTLVATWALSGLYLSLGSSIIGSVLGVRSHFVVGGVLGVFFVSGAIGTAASTALPPRSQQWSGNAALALGVLATVAALLVRSTPLYVVGSVVAGLGFGAAFRFAVHALGEAAPAAARGQVFASMYVVSYLAFSVPALAAGLAVGRFGLEPTVVAYGALDVALVLVALAVGAARTRRQERATDLRPCAPVDA